MSYISRLIEAHMAAGPAPTMSWIPHVPHGSDERGWVTHRVVATLNDEEVGHISVSHIPEAVFDETLADRETFCRIIEGKGRPTTEDLRRAATRHRRFKQFHVDSVHVAYVFVEPEHRRQGIALRMYRTAAKRVGEQGLMLAASDLQRPEVAALWKKLVETPSVPTTTTEDGRPALDYR